MTNLKVSFHSIVLFMYTGVAEFEDCSLYHYQGFNYFAHQKLEIFTQGNCFDPQKPVRIDMV